ncbi:rhomboid family intramembrane serine protease [Aromatoleum aromaticum]|uniref:rhomboid family intramembrane serine protease n=1 Tax=Aromatoleum aromaticum TaxID=551760 RepID=UPI0014598AB8|nr:rhomboid family intramembrane serine protease [Aromatoleum aromaticum]NMG56316.1 rhomboid family intramembrane serine protease [Aromatoleum aromaticum]
MDVDIPDPAYTSSERARASFRLAFRIALCLVAFLWLIQAVNTALDLGLARFGVRPRELSGLPGIVLAPLLHGSFGHLIANTAPLLVLLTAMLHLYPGSAVRALPAIFLGPGAAVWLLGRASVHIGASGVVYGLVAHIFLAGVIRRDRRAIAASLLVYFLYGSLAWGVLPIQQGLSWETHLAGGLIGALSAIALRRLDIPPRRRYAWEDEEGGRE